MDEIFTSYYYQVSFCFQCSLSQIILIVRKIRIFMLTYGNWCLFHGMYTVSRNGQCDIRVYSNNILTYGLRSVTTPRLSNINMQRVNEQINIHVQQHIILFLFFNTKLRSPVGFLMLFINIKRMGYVIIIKVKVETIHPQN